MVGDRAVAKQPREQRECVIGKCRIHEGFLPVECFRSAATRQAVSVKVRLDDLREEFGDRSEPEPVTPVPSIQGFSEDKLWSIRVVAQVQPVIDFAPILCTSCDCRTRFPRVDTPDYAIRPFHSSTLR